MRISECGLRIKNRCRLLDEQALSLTGNWEPGTGNIFF